MSVEKIMEQQPPPNEGEPKVVISPDAKIPGSTTTKVQELVKPPVNIWDRFRGRSNIPASSEESAVAEKETPVSESASAAGGAGNGSEGRGGDGGGEGGGPEEPGGPEIIPGPEKGESPGSIRDKLVIIDTMPVEQREANAGVNGQYTELLTDYANGDKAVQEDNNITDLRRQLINSDKTYINSDPDRTDQEKRALQQLLNDLDEAELRGQEYGNTLALRERVPSRFSDKGWEEQGREFRGFEERIRLLEQEIADPGFLGIRRVEKDQIEAEIADFRKEAERREEDEKNKMLAKPGELEEGLREKDKSIEFTEAEVASLPKFSEVLERLEAQERLRRVNDPNFNETLYNQSKEIVGWYFQEAGRLGILFDLDQQLNSDFEEYMIRLHIKPVDERRLPPEKITIFELRTLIRGNLSTVGTFEANEAWEDLADTVRFSATRTQEQFTSIRAAYLLRGYEQMRASFTNLIHFQERLKLQTDLIRERITDTEYADKVARIPTTTQQNYRVYGEWNFGFESKVRQQLVEQTLAEQARPLFHETELGFIILEGENSREIELAAEQAAEFITNSAGVYSLEAVQQRREYLLRAIENKRSVLSAETGGIKNKTDALVDRIKQVALNKLDFFILQWLADNLRMPEYSSYFEQTVMQKGTDRLKVVPTMSDGLVGLAIRYLLLPEYRLFFKPAGFKNQLDQSGAQFYLRNLLKNKLIEQLMGFELDDQGKGWEGKAKTLQDLMKVQSTDQFIKYFKEYKREDVNSQHPEARKNKAEENYQQALERANNSPDDPDALVKLREARDLRAFELNRYNTAKNRVTNAVNEAIRTMDITGESSRLGSPTILMDNGDYISVDEATLFYKFAILQAGKDYGQDNGMEDNQALIRWRSRMWIDRWKKAGLDRVKAGRDFQAGENGNRLAVSLKEGWEETGLTKEEWEAFEEAVRRLKAKGSGATITVTRRDENGRVVRDVDGEPIKEELKFEDIIKKSELQPVLSNFLADYKSSNNQLNDDYLRLQAFKGRLPAFKNILVRLGLKKPVEGHAQKVLNEYTQRIEDSRAFHTEVERLAYYKATHKSLDKVKKQGQGRTIYMDSTFLEDRIEYGYQGLPWGIKRAQYRKAFEYTNLRRTTPRAVDLIHAIPLSLTSLAQESGSEDILDMCWNLNRSEKDDNWTLMTFAMRTKDAWFIGGALEGDIDLEKGRLWGFLEKLLTDTNSLWTLFDVSGVIDLKPWIANLEKGQNDIPQATREKIIKHLFEVTLSRFTPIIIGAEKQLAFDRQALGSGAGIEENEKFALRFLEWILSEKPHSEEHREREEGGWEAYEEVRDIFRLITVPDSYRLGSSIWDEVWRKLTPGHNPRLPKEAPEPTYVALAA